jgi:hypothetical protein
MLTNKSFIVSTFTSTFIPFQFYVWIIREPYLPVSIEFFSISKTLQYRPIEFSWWNRKWFAIEECLIFCDWNDFFTVISMNNKEIIADVEYITNNFRSGNN